MPTKLPLSLFYADPEKCTGCGMCVADCPIGIIALENNAARIRPEHDARCIGCQHCLAVCPTAAVTVAGKNPADSRPVEKTDAAALERAILARRSVRRFAPGVVPPETIRRILDTINYAPTAVNMRELRFTVVSGDDAMEALRRRTCEGLVERGDSIAANKRWIVSVAQTWLNGGADGIFRNAPHVIIASAGPGQRNKAVDCVIALSYFDLYASAGGIGTTWCGMFDTALRAIPESKGWLGIPDDHEIGYAMLFGNAGVRYARTAQYGPADVNLVERLG